MRRPYARLGLFALAVIAMLAIGGLGGYLVTAALVPAESTPPVVAHHDHGAGDDHGAAPTATAGHDHGAAPTATAGHDHGAASAPTGGHDHAAAPTASAVDEHGAASDHGGHGTATTSEDRPRTAVLATFAAINVGLMATGLVLRRRGNGRGSR